VDDPRSTLDDADRREADAEDEGNDDTRPAWGEWAAAIVVILFIAWCLYRIAGE
jgi:hypothetical protein